MSNPDGKDFETYCTVCGGLNVQSTFWVRNNTGEIVDGFTDLDCTATGGVWCEDCEEHTPLSLRKVSP